MNRLITDTSHVAHQHHRAYYVRDVETAQILGLVHVPQHLDDDSGKNLTWITSSKTHAVEIQPIVCTCNVGKKSSQ
jgi:hypothetical protein